MSQRYVLFVLMISVAAAMSGCVTSEPVRWPDAFVDVDSISLSEQSGDKQTYVLLPVNPNTSTEDLRFKEVGAYVRRVLASNDFIETETDEKAKVAIYLDYGVGDPKTKVVALPTSTTSSYYGGMSGGWGISSGVGYVPTSYTIYTKFISLEARDAEIYRTQKKKRSLWQITATLDSQENDLRGALPFLVAAAKSYIGTNTEKKLTVKLYADDVAVLEVKGVRPKPTQPNREQTQSKQD